MKASEILRKLADVIDGQDSGPTQSVADQVPHQDQSAQLHAVEVDNTDNTEAGTFVPPLQAKLELLKKAVNVDSIYDQGGEDGDLTGQGADNEDPLDTMKKLSGINIVATAEAADDEPFEG
jgi:hypothetical protein